MTANHVITGYNCFTNKEAKNYYDTIGIRYYGKDSIQKLCLFSIKEIKPLFSESSCNKVADVVVLNMLGSKLYSEVFSIENYLQKNIDSSYILDSVVSIGYGVIDPKRYTPDTPPIFGKGSKGLPTHIAPYDKHYMRFNDSLYYPAMIHSWKGMSGGPVFFIYHHFSGTMRIEDILFGGEIFGGYDKYNMTLIVNPEIIIQKLENSNPVIFNYISSGL